MSADHATGGDMTAPSAEIGTVLDVVCGARRVVDRVVIAEGRGNAR